MKKLLLISSIAVLTASCIPDKDKREQRKQDHSAEHMRNKGVDSAAVSSQKNVDTISNKK
ncbi:hypothetical protein [Epilithonimonas sp.]|uniref:hypothetical protein n=1 Tax=Epilithonimonas sp. TaxID=2894511 RepID=UPI002FDE0966